MKKLISIIKERGVVYSVKKAISRIKGSKLPQISAVQKNLHHKRGIEIGGPSRIFGDNGYIPIYTVIESLDGCNFSNTTLWEGEINKEMKYNYAEGKNGKQFISEATELSHISDKTYDFIISSHCLEHVANPLKAVAEWLRIVKDEGYFLLVLPNKEYCFDRKRPFTPFEHLLADYKNNTQEDDLTHLEEIMQLHDLSMDKPAGTPKQFRERSLKNFEIRGLHHHVFSIETLKNILEFFNVEVILTHKDENLILFGKKQSDKV